MEGVTRDQLCAAAVEVVSEQGMPQMGEVDADLMGASGFYADAHKRIFTVNSDTAVQGMGKFSRSFARTHSEFFAV